MENFKVYQSELDKLLTKPWKFPLPEWQPTPGKIDSDLYYYQHISIIDLRMNHALTVKGLMEWCDLIHTVFVIPGDFRGMLIRRDYPHIKVYNIPHHVFIPRAKYEL